MKVSLPGLRWHRVMLRAAAVLTLVALALMVWSVVQPTPMPVLLAMSLGQVLGTAAFGMYGLVVVADLRRQYVRRKELARESQRMETIPDTADATRAEPAADAAKAEPAADATKPEPAADATKPEPTNSGDAA